MGLPQEFLAGQHPILHRGITIQTAIWAEAFSVRKVAAMTESAIPARPASAGALKPFRTRPPLLQARRRQGTKITGLLRSLRILSLTSGPSRSSVPCRAISPAQIPPRLLPALASAAVFSL